jgi:hypothetical protein
LKGGHSRNHQTLEKKCQGRLSSCETTIEESDARDDEPNDEAAEHEIGVVIFEADILGIDIDEKWITTVWFG